MVTGHQLHSPASARWAPSGIRKVAVLRGETYTKTMHFFLVKKEVTTLIYQQRSGVPGQNILLIQVVSVVERDVDRPAGFTSG